MSQFELLQDVTVGGISGQIIRGPDWRGEYLVRLETGRDVWLKPTAIEIHHEQTYETSDED